jgi:uncharacterized protein with NAD-binding domain and iron-sulfur cluster
MAGQAHRERVAVLGGGPAAMAAAFELTAPGVERFDVTVYQPGWRLGGKCASGRNMAPDRGARIEEHGLHIWFGFYENAFELMRRAYDELARPAGSPLATLQDAFKGCDEIVLYDRQDGEWVALAFHPPRNELRPGDGHGPPGFWDIARWMCEWSLREHSRVLAEHGEELGIDAGAARSAPEQMWDALSRLAKHHRAGGALREAQLLTHAHGLAVEAQARGTTTLPRAASAAVERLGAIASVPAEHLLAGLLTGFRDWLWDLLGELCAEDPHVRLFFTIFDTFATATAGIVRDGVLAKGWEAINQYDLCEWLSHHGAKQITVGASPAQRAPMLRAIYDVAFGYPGGRIADANIAAGTAINDFLRLSFSYRGSLMYKMQAGMGDTVLTPFYEVLERRGVKFRFFNVVTGLGLTPDGAQVNEIELVSQVQLVGDRYDPLVDVQDLPCWPSEPRWEQLDGGAELCERGVDFELEPNPLGRPPRTLRLGEDFEKVVLAIAVGALGGICDRVAARHERFAEMLAAAATVPTQAFQLWLTSAPTSLGWSHSQDSVAGCYEEPIDTWCDMTHLLAREAWKPEQEVNGIAYFCGVLEEHPGEDARSATARVRDGMRAFATDELAALWPLACTASGALRWPVLADPRSRASGPARLESQYWRANVTGSERYVLTPAGSVRSRLGAGESGVSNLVLAGDWTRNGIDGGCVESAITSGIQAARELTGIRRELVGERPWLALRRGGPISMPPPLAGARSGVQPSAVASGPASPAEPR